MLRLRYEVDIKQISDQGELNIIILGVIFAGIALKLGKVGPTFSCFNPHPSLPSVATDNGKQFQCLNIILNNKTGPLFLEFN